MKTYWGNCTYPSTNACEAEDVEHCGVHVPLANVETDGEQLQAALAAIAPKRKRYYVCKNCKDKHVVSFQNEVGDVVSQPCTRCPVPCQQCRAPMQGAYCAVTPCACACHTPLKDGKYL